MSWILSRFQKFTHYMQMADGWRITRRYAVLNAFDGILSVLGVVISSFFLEISNPVQIMGTGVSAAIAIGVSGSWIAYLTEEAETIRETERMEELIFAKLEKSMVAEAARVSSTFNSFVNGFSPFVFGSTVLIPFLFVAPGTIVLDTAFYLSFLICAFLLFILGVFLGRISNRNVYLIGIKTFFAGVIIAIILFFLRV